MFHAGKEIAGGIHNLLRNGFAAIGRQQGALQVHIVFFIGLPVIVVEDTGIVAFSKGLHRKRIIILRADLFLGNKVLRLDFTDKISQLPAPGASAIWKYRAIYLYKGEQVGQWSETVSVTVHGIA